MYVSSQSVNSHLFFHIYAQSTLIYFFFTLKQGKDEAAEKQRIKEEKEKEDDDVAERDHQLRLAANEEAKVNNLVDDSWYMQLTMCYLLLDRRRV